MESSTHPPSEGNVTEETPTSEGIVTRLKERIYSSPKNCSSITPAGAGSVGFNDEPKKSRPLPPPSLRAKANRKLLNDYVPVINDYVTNVSVIIVLLLHPGSPHNLLRVLSKVLVLPTPTEKQAPRTEP